MAKTPDLIEPFVGWKGLLADSAGSLYSPAVPTPWPARERLEAVCVSQLRKDHVRDHTPPVKSCSCGIYAVKTFEDLKEHGYNVWDEGAWRSRPEDPKVWVVVRVSLWGDVVEGGIGYRAQYAYPKKIYVPGDMLKLGALIRERYGVSLGIIDRYTGRRA